MALLGACITSFAQVDTTKKNPPAAAQPPAPQQNAPAQSAAAASPGQQDGLSVTDVYNEATSQAPADNSQIFDENDMLVIRIKPIKQPIKDIKLFFNGVAMDDIIGIPQKGDTVFHFKLTRSSKNQSEWNGLLANPDLDHFFEFPVKLGIGINGSPEEPSGIDIKLHRINRGMFFAALIFFVVYLIALRVWVAKKQLLRDGIVDLTPLAPEMEKYNLDKPEKLERPFSLGRTQMAFWFTLVLPSFIFIWLVTTTYDSLTASVLGLIGISSVTALSAIAIDSNKGQDVIGKVLVLRKDNDNDKNKEEIVSLIKSVSVKSSGFIKDVLYDVNGISFHRLQMIIWTLVFGVIFLYSVYYKLCMPDFSANLLALQGIAAGTYLGFKFPEKPAQPTTTAS